MARGRKRAVSREHVTLEEKLVPGEGGTVSTEYKWRCKYCLGSDDGGLRKTVTFPASRFDVHLTAQCKSTPDVVKEQILGRSLSNALKGGVPPTGSSYTALLQKTQGAGRQKSDDAFPVAAGVDGVDAAAAAEMLAAAGLAEGTVMPPAPKRRKVKVEGSAATARRRSVASPRGMDASRLMSSVSLFLCGSGLPLSLASTTLFRNLVSELNPALGAMMERSPEVWYGQGLDRVYGSLSKEAAAGVGGSGTLRTLGLDHFVEDGRLFVNVFESTPAKTAFSLCDSLGLAAGLDETDVVSFVDRYADRCGAKSSRAGEEMFAGIVGSLGPLDLTSVSGLQEKYPRLFVVGCARKTLVSILDGFISIPQVSWAIDELQAVVRFAVANSLISSAELRSNSRASAAGSSRALDVCLQASLLLEKKVVFDAVADNVAVWEATKAASNDSAGAACFEKFSRSPAALVTVTEIRALLSPACGALAHMDQSGCGMSWVFPLFSAIQEDAVLWSENHKSSFSSETLARAADVVATTWAGGLMNDVHTFAWLMDPYTTPTPEELPGRSRESVRVVLERQALNKETAATECLQGLTELEGVLLRDGEWGQVVAECQASLSDLSTEVVAASSGPGDMVPVKDSATDQDGIVPADPTVVSDGIVPADPTVVSDPVETALHGAVTQLTHLAEPVSSTVSILSKMARAGDGSRKWRAYGGRQFTTLRAGAVRALSMSAISPCMDMLRVGGTAAVLGKNVLLEHLKDDSIQRLLYVFVNSRLSVAESTDFVLDRECRFDDFAASVVAMRSGGK